MTKHTKQAGFSTIELVLVLVVTVSVFAASKQAYNAYTEQQASEVAAEIEVQADEPLRYASVDQIELINSANANEAVSFQLKEFFKQYDMDYVAADIEHSAYANEYIIFEEIGVNDLAQYKRLAAQIVDEWAKYPKSWTKGIDVKSVSIVKQISVEGQIRAAAPDVIGDRLYYAVSYEQDYMATVIHHELGHLVEYNLFDSYSRDDPEWIDCHEPGFEYKGGGELAYDDPEYSYEQHPEPGFITSYATYAIEEDKADIYSYLMTDNYSKLQILAEQDSCIAEKVTDYKDLIDDYSPEMTGDYFELINR